jgi:hypothetical protein
MQIPKYVTNSNNLETYFMKRTLTLALVAATMMVSACSKPAADPAAPEAAAPEATAAGAAPTVAAAGSTGVPECDDMYAKVEKCLATKVPEAGRAAMADAMKQSKEAMIKGAAGNKAAMAQSCKAAGEQMKAQYTALGCPL